MVVLSSGRLFTSLFRLAIGVLAVLWTILPPAYVHAEDCPKTFRVGASDDYEPFSYIGADGKLTGLDLLFVQEILAEVGCAPQFVDLPFPRAVVELSAGRIDMMMFASVTAERQNFALFSAPYRNETAGLIIRARDQDKYPINEVGDLLKLNLLLAHDVGTYRGDLFETFMANPEAKKNIIQVSSSRQSLNMLLKGRINAIVEAPAAVFALAETLGVRNEIAEHPFLLWSEPVHFMFSRKTVSPEFVAQIDAVLAEAVQTPEYTSQFGSMSVGSPAHAGSETN
ncbi:amino acid ABC transporter substrate-binding protein [Labrenzia sp. R4_1]|uniref:substrate-binding periplasmic protein n=1 Tax=Labrenzia sp. R4_1 TaxID=2821106 RepID=UPI001ADBB83A|nr:transporter substrate-binding domain-containing protein [Labrenzia sp. R4_1]MBO9424322.1 amino acid ABC transporter substrate-binding protein [Labrenzia sp. R4_1]